MEEILTWIVSGSGAGVAAYAIINEFGGALSARAKRYVALALTAAIAAGGVGASVWLGAMPMPADAQAWVNVMGSAMFVSFGMSQVIHGERDLQR